MPPFYSPAAQIPTAYFILSSPLCASFQSSTMPLSLMTALFAFAALLHGMAGIGFPLVLTAALGLIFSMQETVVLSAIPILLVNLISMSSGKPVRDIFHRYGLLAICTTIGSIFGVKLLLILPSAWLQLALACLIALYLALSLRRFVWRLPKSTAFTLAFGLFAGIVGGASNAMSSVLMMYLFAHSHDKSEISQAANLCFALAKLPQIILLWQDFVRIPQGWQSLILPTLAAIAALYLGIYIRQRMAFRHFQQLIFALLSLLAAVLAYKSLHHLFH